jgi:hypothetical protein
MQTTVSLLTDFVISRAFLKNKFVFFTSPGRSAARFFRQPSPKKTTVNLTKPLKIYSNLEDKISKL